METQSLRKLVHFSHSTQEIPMTNGHVYNLNLHNAEQDAILLQLQTLVYV
jgi:hypothetical protein